MYLEYPHLSSSNGLGVKQTANNSKVSCLIPKIGKDSITRWLQGNHKVVTRYLKGSYKLILISLALQPKEEPVGSAIKISLVHMKQGCVNHTKVLTKMYDFDSRSAFQSWLASC